MQAALQPTFLARLFGAPQRVPVRRLFPAHVRHGATRALVPQPGKVTVHCRSGETWITHDGDPKDVLLHANESYEVRSAGRMTLHALRGDCLLEIQVDA